MEVAKVYYPYPLFELFLVLAFPIAYILCDVKKVWKNQEVQFAVLYVLCSWLEFTLLYENGERKYHGNFEWAVCLAYAVIWTVTSLNFFRNRQLTNSWTRREKAKNNVLFLIWMMHFISGVFFVWNMLTVQKLYF